MTITLNPVYDSRKSFYGKANVIHEDGVVKLQSYSTIVAYIDSEGAHVNGTYSPTTLRHIKDFLYQHGFEIGSKSFIEDNYMD